MMTNEIRKMIEEKALTDDRFLTNLITAKDIEETQKVLAENGFEFSVEEIRGFCEEGKTLVMEANDEGELSEDALEAVAGGGKWRGRLRYALGLLGGAALGAGFGAFCAFCPAAAAAVPYVAVGYAGLVTLWVMDGYDK